MAESSNHHDPFSQWRQSLEQMTETLSASLAQTMASEEFAAVMGRALDQYLNVVGPARKNLQAASEEILRTFNLPSRTQVTRLASSVVGVDQRVETIDDRLEAMQETLEGIARRMAGMEEHFHPRRTGVAATRARASNREGAGRDPTRPGDVSGAGSAAKRSGADAPRTPTTARKRRRDNRKHPSA